MAITRIQNNQITDATIVAYAKVAAGSLTGNLFAPTVTLNSNVTINGNLFLSNTGNVTTINATNTYINDPLVMFNNGYTGSLTGYDIGILINRNLSSLANYGGVNTFLGWVEADNAFETLVTTDTGTGVTSINNSGWANFKTGNVTALTATTGGLQAVAIGNVTPGVANFTTVDATTLRAATIGNAGANAQLGFVTAATINAATIGNTGASLVGTLSGASVSGTVTTANVSIYDSVAPYTNNQTFYLQFSNIATAGNTAAGVNSSLAFNPGAGSGTLNTGTLVAATVNAATIGNASASGQFGTVTATTLNAATIGNASASLVGSTATLTGLLTASTVNAATIGNAGANAQLGFVTATTVNAATIGNTSATLVGAVLATTINASGNIVANSSTGSLTISGNAITSNTGVIGLGGINNVGITGGANGYTITTTGGGVLSFNAANAVVLGSNASGQFVSAAVTLTNTTNVTDALAQLNQILGKLTPASPPTFPGNVATSVGAASSFTITTGQSSGIMTGDSARGSGWTQKNNISGNTYQLAGGTTFSAIRSNTYATSTLAAIKSGQGNIVVYLGGNIVAGYFTLTGSSGTNSNGNLTVTNDTDYNNIKSTVAAGFWQSANISASSGAGIQEGWNTVTIADIGGYTLGNTNALLWYNDVSVNNVGTPTFSNSSMTMTTNTVVYSSTIPHLTSGATFRLKGNVANLSGDTYVSTANTNITTSTAAGGAFNAPTAVATSTLVGPAGYAGTVPLPRYLCNATYGGVYSGTAYFETPSTILASGFGSSSSGPSVTISNNYNSAAGGFTPGVTILYKNGTSVQIEETSIPVNSVGTGSGNGYRILNPGSTNNPAYTGSEAAFNSTSSTLTATDATNIGSGGQGIIQYDVTNYSTGYLPVGPNLSSGRGATQYFTMKFVRTAVSKFDVKYTGTIAGLWIALPGLSESASYGSSTNGWFDMGTAYAGAGTPGTGGSANGSAGCAVGGVAVFNSAQTNKSVTGTFGALSSSSSTGNEIYVRVALTSGQSLTALTMEAATH